MAQTGNTPNEDCRKKPGQDALDACKKFLCIEKPAAYAAATAAYTEWSQGVDTYEDKKRCYQKAKCTLETYQGLDYAAGLVASAKSEAIKKCVEDYVKKDVELAAMLKQAAKTLKTLKEKIAELKSAACGLDTCVNDSCNAQQITIITKTIPDFKEQVKTKLIEAANKTNTDGDATFMDAVEVTGIQTFTNVDNLVDKSKKLCDLIKTFKGNLDTNVKERTEEVKTTQGDLAKSITDLSGKSTTKRKLTNYYEGVADMLDFACNPTEPNDTIDEICEKVKNTFRPEKKERPDDDDGSQPPTQSLPYKQRPPARAGQFVANERL